MSVLLWLAALALAATVLSHVLLRGGNASAPPPPPRERVDDKRLPRVSIVVPARNEAHNLPRLVESLTKLDYPDYEVLVVEGGSTDGTRALADAAAALDARVRVVDEPPLPADWVGKSWACWHGRKHATGEWLLFTDADTMHAPDTLRRVIAAARVTGARFLTGVTAQELDTFWERAIMPPVFTLVFAAGGGWRPERLKDPEHAIGNGQFMLYEAAAYDRIGGHARVRGSVVEDLALARVTAAARVHPAFVDLTRLVSTRMYRSVREMAQGWRKNLAAGATETPPRAYALTVLTFLGGILAAPVAGLAALTGAWPATGVAVAAYAYHAWRVRGVHATTTGVPAGHALLHPLGYAFFGVILAVSALDRWTGRGATWKGRTYTHASHRNGKR